VNVTAGGNSFDLIVVGLGAVGSAALNFAAHSGLRVLGIDQYSPPHTFGSTHAESRITRLAVGEGAHYLPFVARSHQIWRELEARTGEQLLFQSGGYIITPPGGTDDDRWGGFVHRTNAIAQSAAIPFEIQTHAQVRAKTDRLRLQPDEVVGYEPTGGIVLCERAIAVQLGLAQAAGAVIRTNTKVTSVEPDGGGVVVVAGAEVLRADAAIVATGPWFAELAPPVDAEAVTVTRQVVYWFDVEDPQDFSADRFPFVMWPGHTIADYSAVFPRPPGGRPGLKLLGEQFHRSTTPNEVDREVHESEINDFYERLVATRVAGVKPRLLHCEVCLYTNTIDDHFLIDAHPDTAQIMFASPCSGHGFKHSPAIGEALVQQVRGIQTQKVLQPFARTDLTKKK